MKKLYIVLLLLISGLSADAKKKKVLFIGNSYIYTNNMPVMLQQLCTAMGDTLVFNQHTPGGYTLQGHSSDANTLNMIKSDNWDIVLIQEQSQRPAFSQGQVATDTYPYATSLYNAVKANSACSEVMFMMTWGYKNGDAGNCAVYPPICTYQGMQDGLRFSYMKMAQDNQANVAPVGAAWKVVRDSFASIDLYSPDNSHPSLSGSYLEACVLYASMYHKSPVGASYLGGVAAADAAKLQRIAAKVTLDSLEQWQQYGNLSLSKFTIVPGSGKSVTFTNNSKRATSYFWQFGDGSTSTAAAPPAKTYTAAQNYPVILTATNSCNSDSYVDTARFKPVTVENNPSDIKARLYRTEGGKSCIEWDGAAAFSQLLIYDMNGRVLKNYSIAESDRRIIIDLAPGGYIYRLLGNDNATDIRGRFTQY